MRKLGPAVIALGGLWIVRAASAQDAEPSPGLDFLEYLGSWQGRDDEWLAIAQWDEDHPVDAERRAVHRARNDDEPADADDDDAAADPIADPPPPTQQGNGQ